MYGDSEEEVDGTELAAEWAFSSLQKFGQEFLKKLRGKKMPNKLLEKVSSLCCNIDTYTPLPRFDIYVTDMPLRGVACIISSSLLGVYISPSFHHDC